MTTWLSDHFSLEELTASQTAARQGIRNDPPPAERAALSSTAERMEDVREILGGKVITVSSGYRSPALNAAVGGTAKSAHVRGRAVDFICPRFGSPLDICRALAAAERRGEIRFDQLIEEGTWVHISFDPRLRGEVLTAAKGGGYVAGLRP